MTLTSWCVLISRAGRRARHTLLVVSPTIMAGCSSIAGSRASTPAPFVIEETTIEEVHRAFASGRLTCRALVAGYLERIEAYDRAGPALTAIVTVNDRALTIADSLDRRWRETGPIGPLHCVPFVVKDNIATEGLRTTVGSAAFAELIPRRDAVAVRRVKEAGGVILAKGHLSEFAISYARTVGSILPGETRNPYNLDYTPAGSSGGVATAVAANLALVGLASETGKSIRGPAAYTALVGLRTTIGLISTRGVAPLRPSTVGPMTRTVTDLTTVLNVLAGVDREDTVTTVVGTGRRSYSDALRPNGLRGTRIAIGRQTEAFFRPDSTVTRVFEQALGELRRLGAVLIDSLPIDTILYMPFVPRRPAGSAPRRCSTLKFDLADWLEQYGTEKAPRLPEILESGRFHPPVRSQLEQAAAVEVRPEDNPDCAPSVYGDSVRAALLRVMDGAQVDAVVYPTWVTLPSKVGGPPLTETEMLTLLPHAAGLPSLTLPMGYSSGGIPLGLEFFGRSWQEATLLRIAFAYEQGTHHRRPPAAAPH